jgi:serine/threonine-protein kinase SRPK3
VIERLDHQPLAPHAPSSVVAPITVEKWLLSDLVLESIVIIDFGQSFSASSKPENYRPATAINFRAPETRFENRCEFATDMWSLACLIFEIRTGKALFSSWFATEDRMIKLMVYLLGRPPDPWWDAWEGRNEVFDESGKPLAARQFGMIPICERLRKIGNSDDTSHEEQHPVFEKKGVRLNEDEVMLLGDLLEKMLRYRPEDRITIKEVVLHPWFLYAQQCSHRRNR